MKKLYLLVVLLLLSVGALMAQNIFVKSFKPLVGDMTTTSQEGKRIDQNNEVAALIRVVTSETGFAFEAGAMGVVDTKQKVGEIWVWVPRGSRRISIMHQQLGILRDYRYPVEIEADRTYEMVLTTAKVETLVKEEVRMQYLVFQITPPNAVLTVNDELWEVSTNGTAMQFVDFGTYTYRVQAKGYHPDAGKVTVNDPTKAQRVTVNLQPDFVQVTLKVDADAEIWVNDEKKGIRSWTGPLDKSSYKIECRQAGHETTVTTQKITAEMDGQTIVLPAPKPVYGSLNVESTPFAMLYIDGKAMGETPYFVPEILVGQHEIKLAKAGYADHVETVTVEKGGRKQVKATLDKQDKAQPVAATTDASSEDLTFTVKGVPFVMKFVEGGTFSMGATAEQDSDAFEDEKPVHSVTLNHYYLGETEVTQALWQAVMGSGPTYSGGWENKYGNGDDFPTYRVSWNDVQEFITKLNQLTGKNFRLPTEAEWEYAARGGKKSHGYKYAGSDTLDDVAWYNYDRGRVIWFRINNGKTHAVKTKSPNELGLYDMSGNVREWCQDWMGGYNKGQQANPQGPASGYRRVLRGGSWYYTWIYCRVSDRNSEDPVYRNYDCGFRLALSE